MGGAFEQLFCPEGREFEQANLQKFKCPGDFPGGGVLRLQFDDLNTLLGRHFLPCLCSLSKFGPSVFITRISCQALAKWSRKSTQVGSCELANTDFRWVAKRTRKKTQVENVISSHFSATLHVRLFKENNNVEANLR